jgi:hypothetical protein
MLQWADYAPNDMLVGNPVGRFLDDVMACRIAGWGNYCVPAVQRDNVFAQLPYSMYL